MTIGAALNRRRAEAGISMDELARAMGFAGQSSIQRYLAPDYDLELRPDMQRKFDTALPETVKPVSATAGASPVIVLRTILCANPTAEQIVAALAANGLEIVEKARHSEDPSLLRALVNDKATTGLRIAAARKAAGLSQEKLAEALGCHVVTVSKLETGVMDLTMEWILRFADALRVPVTRFTEDKDIIHDPKGYVQSVLERHNIKPGTLAKNIGMAGSTFTRAFHDQNHKYLFSTKTLRKIKEWDQCSTT